MSGFSFRRYLPKLKTIFDVRARLVLVALILVVPLMLDRVHILESSRANQIKAASAELAGVARRGAQAQREMVKTVEGMLRTAASIYVHAHRLGRPCALLDSGFKVNMRGIGNISVVDKDGRVVCSTLPVLVGVDITDRHYFHDALAKRQLRAQRLRDRQGLRRSVDHGGVPDLDRSTRRRGGHRHLDRADLARGTRRQDAGNGRHDRHADRRRRRRARFEAHTRQFVRDAHGDRPSHGSQRAKRSAGSVSSGSIAAKAACLPPRACPDTNARLIVSIDERAMLASIDRDIRAAYLQLGLVGLLVLIGAWFMSERADHPADPAPHQRGDAIWRRRHDRAQRAERPAAGIRAAGAGLQRAWQRGLPSASVNF